MPRVWSVGTTRLSTVKSVTLGFASKKATASTGRKLIAPPPIPVSKVVQLMIACVVLTVNVSCPGARLMVTLPVLTVGLPWNACACAFGARASAVIAMAIAAPASSAWRRLRVGAFGVFMASIVCPLVTLRTYLLHGISLAVRLTSTRTSPRSVWKPARLSGTATPTSRRARSPNAARTPPPTE